MHLVIDRILSDNDATLSLVYLDGEFICFGLEDEYRADKVPSETRIPQGNYKVGVRQVGGFDARYRAKFGSWHKGMLHVLDVPEFEHILIHIGNTDEDTAGCLLVGMGANTANELSISNSTAAYQLLYTKVIDAAKADDLIITYVNSDRSEYA